MLNIRTVLLACCVLLLLCSATVAAQTTLHSKLVLADDIRVSDRVRSRALLAELSVLPLSAYENDFVTYLQAFHRALDSKIPQAIAAIEPIRLRHRNDELGLRTRATLLSLYAGTRAWSDGLVIASELKSLMDALPANRHWYTARIGLASFYLNLELFSEALQVIDNVDYLKLPSLSTEMRCRFATYEFRALKGIDIHGITPEWLVTFERLCFSIPDTLYTMETVIIWSAYLLATAQYTETLTFINQYKQRLYAFNFFYFDVALKDNEAEALFELKRYADAGRLADEMLARPELADYKEGYSRAAALKARLYEQKGNMQQAYRWQLIAAEGERYNKKAEVSRQLAVNKAEMMLQSAHKALDLLAGDQAILASRVRLAKQQVLGSSLLIVFTLTSVCVVVLVLQRIMRQRNALAHLASTDALTGLNNRRWFMEAMQRALKNKETQQPVGLIMFDLDNLKWINDRFGHQTGDWVLEKVGGILAALDIDNVISIARVGGEEFMLGIAGMSADAAIDQSEIIQQRLALINTEQKLDGALLSASFGVCDSHQVGNNVNALISAADLAMYQAKRSGRRRVIKYHAEQVI